MILLEKIGLFGGVLFYAYGTYVAFSAVRSGDRRGLNNARLGALCGAWFHALFLFCHGITTGRFPIAGAFQAFICLAAVVMLVSLALDWLRNLPILVVGTLPLALVTGLLALALSAAPRSPGGAGGWTVGVHVVMSLSAYGAFALAFVTAVLYLIEQRHLKQHNSPSILGLMPALETVARINARSIALGVALLAAGLVVGYLQARTSGFDRSWRWDPKLLLTTFTLLAYTAILILSPRPAFRGRRTAIASVFGFFLVLATFWASVFWSDFHRFH